MEFATLTLMKRDATGKGSSRTLRMSGLVPGIIYGREVPQPIKVALELKLLKKAIEGKYKRNTVLSIQIEGEKDRNILAMLQDYQVHPSTRKVIHVDFITVDPGRELEIRVPLRTTGKAVGVTKGGLLMEILHEIPITCLPEKIPVEVELDVSRLDIGQSMKVSDLPLPEGARSVLPPEQPVVSVTTIKEEKEVVEAAPVEGEAAAAAPGEEKEGKAGEEKEGKEAREGKEAKEGKDVKEGKEAREGKEKKEGKERKERKER